jgi:hypothetical protein
VDTGKSITLVAVDHVTVYRWVQRFMPLLAEVARPCRMPSASAGSWTRPRTWVAAGASCTGGWISSERSSMYWSPLRIATTPGHHAGPLLGDGYVAALTVLSESGCRSDAPIVQYDVLAGRILAGTY